MIRVFVGTDSDIHHVAERVLLYSIAQNTSSDVKVNFIRPGWKVGCTGFTTHRYLVPRLCGFEGFAIYLDVDMIVLGDLTELWEHRHAGKWCVTRKSDDAVSVIDCSAFTDLPMDHALRLADSGVTARKIIGDRLSVSIPTDWNVYDAVTPDAKIVHYTNLATQPWHPVPNFAYKPHESQAAVDLFNEYRSASYADDAV